MSRRPNIIPSVQLNVALPLDVHSKLTAFLFSELEGRVPLGAYQAFLVERIREYFSHRQLDVGPFANTDAGVYVVQGPAESIRVLEMALKGEVPVG